MDKVAILKHGFNSKVLRVPADPKYKESIWKTTYERMQAEGWDTELISRTDRRYFVIGTDLARSIIKMQAAYEMDIQTILELDCKAWDNLANIANEDFERIVVISSKDVLKLWDDKQPERFFND